jgi:uncharacterized integral membrane protein
LLILGIALAIGAVSFALQNDVPVTVMLSHWRFDNSLAVALLVALGLGSLIAALVSTPHVIEGQWARARLRRHIASVEKDKEDLERRLLALELEIARLRAAAAPSMMKPALSAGSIAMPLAGDQNLSKDGAHSVRVVRPARQY